MSENSQIVRDVGRWEWSEMWKKEDWWAIWLGFAILMAGIILYLPYKGNMKAKLESLEDRYGEAAGRTDAFRTIAWYELNDAKAGVQVRRMDVGKWLSEATKKTYAWTSNPLDGFFMSQEKAEARAAQALKTHEAAKIHLDERYAAAMAAEKAAEAEGFQSAALNQKAEDAIRDWRTAKRGEASAKSKLSSASPYNQVFKLAGLGVFFALFFGLGLKAMGHSFTKFIKGFGFVFLLAVVAYLASSQTTMKHYGIDYAAWAILFGLIISNTIGTPRWVSPAIQTEFYIKTGLVLLGAEILFEKVITIGTAGIFVAWVVTPVVWLVTYWFGQKILKLRSKRLNAVICSDMSVCGVSAAIASASACGAKKEELTLAVGLSLVFTSIMMVVMPAVILTFFPADKVEVLGGAWMGGTIDATGAVAAAGAFLGEKALNVAATIKMIQNVLIGVMAFCIAVYFTTRVEAEETGQKVGLMEIWYRFPKFVIGFVLASLIFSGLYSWFNAEIAGLGSTMIDKGVGSLFRGWFFCLAFVSIGLGTNFKALKEHFSGGKPLVLYVAGQSFNLLMTLVMAYIVFYLVFPNLTATI